MPWSDRAEIAFEPSRVGRILVVDDERGIREILTAILNDHHVVTAEDGADALVQLRKWPRFDLIVSDILMPNMDGRRFYQAAIQEFPFLASRFAFMTGGSVDTELDQFVKTQRHVLRKPFTLDQVTRIIRSVVAC
jgi:CheY-like chemotaxis protein